MDEFPLISEILAPKYIVLFEFRALIVPWHACDCNIKTIQFSDNETWIENHWKFVTFHCWKYALIISINYFVEIKQEIEIWFDAVACQIFIKASLVIGIRNANASKRSIEVFTHINILFSIFILCKMAKWFNEKRWKI